VHVVVDGVVDGVLDRVATCGATPVDAGRGLRVRSDIWSQHATTTEEDG
jgi:hypothetical protein